MENIKITTLTLTKGEDVKTDDIVDAFNKMINENIDVFSKHIIRHFRQSKINNLSINDSLILLENIKNSLKVYSR